MVVLMGVTKGMIDEFGADRLVDTPISEPAIIGTAVGAAMAGMRPVAELMYVDFIGMAMDQLCNQAAKIRYMFGGQIGVPMVLRTQGGTGRSAGAQHSQSLEAYVMHTPGLRLAMPGTVYDAYHLLRQALVQPDPVVFIEHKSLYAISEDVDLSVRPPRMGQGRGAPRGQGSRDSHLFPAGPPRHGGRRRTVKVGNRGHGDRSANAQPAGF